MSRVEIRPNRWINLPFLVADVFLLTVFAQVVFFDGFDQGSLTAQEPLSLGFKLVFGFFMAIGVFMFFVLLYRLIRAPAVFWMDSEGFELNPAGVNLGRYKWSDVLELRDIEVITNRGGIGGPALEPALGVILRDPEAYTARFSSLLKPLVGARNAMSGTPLVLDPAMFGTRYQEIVSAMRAEIARANAHESGRRA